MAPAFIVRRAGRGAGRGRPRRPPPHRGPCVRSNARLPPPRAGLRTLRRRCPHPAACRNACGPAAQPRTPAVTAGRPRGEREPYRRWRARVRAHVAPPLESALARARGIVSCSTRARSRRRCRRIGSNELLSILRADAGSTGQRDDDGRGGARILAERLLRDIAQNARKLGYGRRRPAAGKPTRKRHLGLMAKLFDSLLDGARFDPHSRQRIDRLLVPYTRVAVRDRDMFDSREHPACACSIPWPKPAPATAATRRRNANCLDRVDRTIDRVVAEFNEDAAIFETLEQELGRTWRSTASVSSWRKRRAAQARLGANGSNRRDAAAAAEILARRGDRALPAIVAGSSIQHVAHHQPGDPARWPGSARHAEAVQAIDDLLAAFDRGSSRSHRPKPCRCRAGRSKPCSPVPDLPANRPRWSSSMSWRKPFRPSWARGAARARGRRDRASGGKRNRGAAGRARDANAVASRRRRTAPPRLAVVGGTDLLDFETDMLAGCANCAWATGCTCRMRPRMEPGQGVLVSPISSRLLLVNRRGVRVLTASTAELAAMVKLGKAWLATPEAAFAGARPAG